MSIKNLHSEYLIALISVLTFWYLMFKDFNIDLLLHLTSFKIEGSLSRDEINAGLSNATNLVSKLNCPPRTGNFTVATLSTINLDVADILCRNMFDASIFGCKRKESWFVVIKNKNSAFGIFLFKRYLSVGVEELKFEFLVRFPLVVVNDFNFYFAPFLSI